MDWKISLDRYLTTPYDDGFDGWYEDVVDKVTDDFYEANEKWLVDDIDGQCNKWLIKLFKCGKNSTEAAQIIERAYERYKNS